MNDDMYYCDPEPICENEASKPTKIVKNNNSKISSEKGSFRVGRIHAVIGPVVDVIFDDDNIPDIMNAMEVSDYKAGPRLVLEVNFMNAHKLIMFRLIVNNI